MKQAELDDLIAAAAETIANADAILIGAGAGMGVDSGLPDFRGDEGFWRAYPPFRELGLSFVDLANPRWFETDPNRAWGFYGHRLNLYRNTQPHSGFDRLLNWCRAKKNGYFVFTSNVDGQFQKSGFEERRILECHGSIHHLQCTYECSDQIQANHQLIVVDEESMLAVDPLPTCQNCGEVTRPNILMFGDFHWRENRSVEQSIRYENWLADNRGSEIAILEFGAGTAVPTVRYECERRRPTLIRINPREAHGPRDTIGIPLPAKEAIDRIDAFFH
jgi:NAD-dependent SIR2 family protein deacetylase